MHVKGRMRQFLGSILFGVFLSASSGWCLDYAVYLQSFRATKTTDNSTSPQSQVSNTLYLTLVNVTHITNSVALATYVVQGKSLTEESKIRKVSSGTIIRQGSGTKILFSYLEDLTNGRFSWSRGNLESLLLGRTIEVVPWVQLSGVGIPLASDNPPFFKEFRLVGWLHRAATTAINNGNYTDDEDAIIGLENYFKSKGYTVTLN